MRTFASHEADLGTLIPWNGHDHVVLVDMDTPFAMPVHSAISALVYNLNCGAVDTVIVDGQVLMKDKTVLIVDEKAILKEARMVCKKLFERAGVKTSQS